MLQPSNSSTATERGELLEKLNTTNELLGLILVALGLLILLVLSWVSPLNG